MALDSVKGGTAKAAAMIAGWRGMPWSIPAAGGWLRDTLIAEAERCFLWLPVLFGIGIGLYFALPVEPLLWLAAVLAGLAVLLLLAVRAFPAARILLVVLAMPLLGFAAATWRTADVAAPVLTRPIGPVEVQGRIVDLDRQDNGFRVLLDQVTIAGWGADRTPARVRIRLRTIDEPPQGGERIAVRARLVPPSAPSLPDGFDFPRFAWFQRLGGVGSAIGPVRRIDAAAPGGFEVTVTRLRAAIERRIEAAVGQATEGERLRAAVAVALVTGKRGGITDDVNDAMRDSGLAHVLAISGHHISLIAAFVFFLVRGGIALVPPLALRVPGKKIATVTAFVVAFGYLHLSGNTVPTQRAVLMLGVIAIAVLFDRLSLTLRTTAIAALVVLAAAPETLIGASFQLSFAAVVALVAAYEAWRDRPRRDPGLQDVSLLWRGAGRVVAFMVGVVVTTAIASLATAPFVAYNFDRLPLYGMVGNLLAMPVVSLWIMPWALVTLVLMPFGLHGLALVPMGWGIDLFVAAARLVAGWRHATIPLTGMTAAGIAIFTVGGCWLLFWHRRWRWLGAAAMVAGCLTPLFDRPPSILIAEDGRLVAIRTAAPNQLWVPNPKASAFVLGVWRQRLGDPDLRAWPKTGMAADGMIACDRDACRIRYGPHRVVVLRRLKAAETACRDADILVSSGVLPWRLKFRGACSGVTVLDRIALRRSGAQAIDITAAGMVRHTVRDARGQRPWTRTAPRAP